MSNKIYVVGVGMTQFGRHIERSLESLGREALDMALKDAGAKLSDIQVAYYSGVTQGALQGQTAIPGQILLTKLGIQGIPSYNIENACASGTAAFQLAVQSLQSGAADICLALGAEKMNIEDKSRGIALFEGGWDVLEKEKNAELLLALGNGIEAPEGSESDRPYSRFMAIYAATSKFWMKSFGTTQRQIAAISSKNHMHSVHNPYSQYRKPFSIEEVLNAPPITYPLTLPMCSPLSDGAAATIVCNEDGLRKLGIKKSRAIEVVATSLTSATLREANDFENAACKRAALKAYEEAGLGPEDISVVEVHDATAVGELLAADYLGLTPMGGSGPAAEAGDFSIGGRVPINPSGGLECKGHPIGATGLGQIFELITQLRGEAGARQVEGARVALQENGGGSIGYEEGVVAVNIFKK